MVAPQGSILVKENNIVETVLISIPILTKVKNLLKGKRSAELRILSKLLFVVVAWYVPYQLVYGGLGHYFIGTFAGM